MSHLGDLLSALVDGELSGTELDRANAHLAACGACRVEARALRRLKHELRLLAEFAEVSDTDEITGRLLAMSAAGPGAKVPRQRWTGPYPVTARRGRPGRRRRRGRYVLWTTLTLVVVGIGTAFGVGGGGSAGPKITPQLEVFDAQHAVNSGDVPFPGPTELSARVPAVAGRR